jgi:hypothetical protein
MDVVRQGSVGKDFLVHTGYPLTAPDALKLRFIGPDQSLRFEVEDPDVAAVGDPSLGDIGWTDEVGSFPIATDADLGIWTIIPIYEKAGVVLPGAPSMQFKVISQYAQS